MALVGDEDESEYYTAGDEEFADVKHAQAAHSTIVGNIIYAVSNQSAERFNLFFEALLQWHLLFKLEPLVHGVKHPRLHITLPWKIARDIVRLEARLKRRKKRLVYHIYILS